MPHGRLDDRRSAPAARRGRAERASRGAAHGRPGSDPPAPGESAGHHSADRQRRLRDPRRAGQRLDHRPHGGPECRAQLRADLSLSSRRRATARRRGADGDRLSATEPGPRFDAATWSPATWSDSGPGTVSRPTRASSRRETSTSSRPRLTGESMPVEKDAGDIEVAPRQPADARNVVVPRHVGRERYGDGAGRGDRPRDRVRRHRRAPVDASSRDGVRARHAAVRALDHAHGVLPRPLRASGRRAAAPRVSRVAALRGGPRGGPDPRVPAA